VASNSIAVKFSTSHDVTKTTSLGQNVMCNS